MNDRNTFLAERMTGLGGSDIGAIFNLNPYRDQVDVWLEKTGQAPAFEGNLQTRFGTFAEEFVAKEYEADTGRKVQRYNAMLRHPKFDMIIGHVDRLVIPEGAKKASHMREIRTGRGWEGKTASAYAAGSDEWGQSGTDMVPGSYLVQCATYMALTECQLWDLSVLFGNQEVRHYTLNRDTELEEELLNRSAEWWKKHVINGVRPEPENEEQVRKLFPKDKLPSIEATIPVMAAVERLKSIKRDIETLEEDAQKQRDIITTHMGENAVLQFQGADVATFKANKDSTTTDWKAVANAIAAPANVIELFTKPKVGTRQFRLK